MKRKRNPLVKAFLVTLLSAHFGCSTAETLPNEVESNGADNEEIHKLLTDLNSRMKSLEGRINTINDKLDATREHIQRKPSPSSSLATPGGIAHADLGLEPSSSSGISTVPPLPVGKKKVSANRLPVTGVIDHPSRDFGKSIDVPLSPHDPAAGFVNDEAVQSFRKARILFEGQKYPESILAFSDFLEKYPDHALAGAAQYSIGGAYLRQREYKLAIKEFERVLTSYDRSSCVSNTLNELAYAEEALKMNAEAAKHRQLLTSLFPQSPAMVAELKLAEPEKHLEKAPEKDHERPSKEKASAEKTGSELDAPPLANTHPPEDNALPAIPKTAPAPLAGEISEGSRGPASLSPGAYPAAQNPDLNSRILSPLKVTETSPAGPAAPPGTSPLSTSAEPVTPAAPDPNLAPVQSNKDTLSTSSLEQPPTAPIVAPLIEPENPSNFPFAEDGTVPNP